MAVSGALVFHNYILSIPFLKSQLLKVTELCHKGLVPDLSLTWWCFFNWKKLHIQILYCCKHAIFAHPACNEWDIVVTVLLQCLCVSAVVCVLLSRFVWIRTSVFMHGFQNDFAQLFLEPITRRQILDSSKLIEFADDIFKFDENGRKLSKWVENTVGKGEIVRYEQFLLFPQCFQKACFPETSKDVIVWKWVKWTEMPGTSLCQRWRSCGLDKFFLDNFLVLLQLCALTYIAC